tara:strand:- start:12574 stop:13371 length:798 start_codon:yes stop_codon:yes gene_type:complete
MTNLVKRVVSGFFYSILCIGAIMYSKESYLTLISIFGILCIREFFNMIKYNNVIIYILFLIILYLEYSVLNSILLLAILLILSLSGSIQLMINLFLKNNHYPSNKLQKFDISIRYLLLSFIFLIFLPIVNQEYEESIILSLVIFIWVNDSFAFFVGKNFGKRKLFESVSPKKTLEGFFGGIIFTLITAFILSYFDNYFSLNQLIVISLMTSVLGTIGDLVESKFKRQAKIKDSGTLIPGHGGLLDRLDSLLFVAPFVYLYINFII